MKVDNIYFSNTNLFSALVIDFIENKENTKSFYNYNNTSFDIELCIEHKKNENIDRELLASAIQHQYQHISDKVVLVDENIELLKLDNSFCIVTAHQLNVFTGPLYYIYKIAQIIATCHQLKQQYPNYNFIPIYWMGSEDHDFAEINHISLFNKKIEWNDAQSGATGTFSTENILLLIDEIKNILGEQTYTSEIIQLFKDAYAQENLTKATRFLVNKLFGNYGLVVVDGNDTAFKKQFSNIMLDDLKNHNAFRLVEQTNKALTEHNYKSQATVREINLFYLKDNLRERIVFDADKNTYQVLNTTITFTEEQIQTELNTHPERFSPNVILRPLFQQKILPSIAYIGGAGEIAYWLQLKTTFEFYKINFPILLLRNSALLLTENINKRIEKLNLNIIDFFADVDVIKRKYIDGFNQFDIAEEKENMLAQFKSIQSKIDGIDSSLVGFLGAEQNKLEKSLETIEAKVLKALKQKNENSLNQIEKVYQQIFPNQNLQEREENFSVYYAKYGQSFIYNLIKNFDVFNQQFLIISLD